MGPSLPAPRGSSAQRPLTSDTLRIREVWADNLEEEMQVINQVVEEFPYLAMDTEFPGVVARPVGTFKTPGEYQFQTLRCNVDMLKLIQLGLTFCDAEGRLPLVDGYYCAWQFNFREFNIHEDVYAQDSIELLRHSGIDFKAHSERGIDVHKFGELLMISGVVLSDTVRWITFHSGYDFGYLLKLVTCRELPATEAEFFDILLTYFPTIYDMKYLQKFVGGPNGLHGGLQKLADALDVERIGPQHQAGSDSLLTANTFFKMRNVYFSGQNSGTDAPLTLDKYANVLYGLGVDGKALDEEGNAAD